MKGKSLSILAGIILFFLAPYAGAQDVVIDSWSSTSVSCGNGSDGTITVNVSGGVGNYTFVLQEDLTIVENSGPIASSTYTFTGHTAFPNYMILVIDEDNTTQNGFTFASIDGPIPLSLFSYSSQDISCNNTNDGSITVNATGEDGNFIYTLSGPVSGSNSSGDFTGLSAGDYTVTATHATCPTSETTPVLTITNPSTVSVGLDAIVDVACYGDNTGSIAISPLGGTPGGGSGYTYLWSGPNGYTSTVEDPMGLEAGDYTVSVDDGNGCSGNGGVYTIDEPTELSAVLIGTTNVSCNSGNDGTASMSPAGGTGGYSYSWDGQFTGLVSTAQNPTNLLADTYDFTLFDNSGCSRTFLDYATIAEPQPLTAALESTSDVSCPGGSDGNADISPSGGTGPYTFLWTGLTNPYTSADEDPAGMPADTYDLIITDSRGCNITINAILVIGQPDPINVTIDGSTAVSCYGGNDGTASITASGGTPSYNYVWTGNVSGQQSFQEDPTDLVADTYTLDITDGNGCPQNFPDLRTIGEPDEISVVVDQVVDVNCNGESTGSISITAAGGNVPLSYSWSGPNGFTSTDDDISGLEAGVYNLVISDPLSCSKEFLAVATVGTHPTLSATFVLRDLSCAGADDGSINATVSGGVPNYTFSWAGPSGYTNSSENISGLAPGDYSLSVSDDLGCTSSFPAQTIGSPTEITASATSVDIDCFGADDGSIDLSVSGGTSPYVTAWTGPNSFSSSDEDLSMLEPGSYSVSITDDNGCTKVYSDITTINESPEITATAVPTHISCAGLTDGNIALTVAGGLAPYTPAWTGPNGFTSALEDPTMLETGTYSVSITDALGCVVDFPDITVLNEPPAITATLVSSIDLSCNGDNGGSAEIDVSGGTAPLVFSWTNAAGTAVSTDEDPTGLAAGTYSLNINDANACSMDYADIVTLDEPDPLVSDLSAVDIICYGAGDGQISVSTIGGTPPFEYSRIGNIDLTYGSDPLFTALGAGLYTIWTRDANGCVHSDTVSINEPQEIQILGETKAGQNLCFGDASASITIDHVTGGVEPYEYSIDGGFVFQSSNSFLNLPAGNYQTVVRDASGCESFGNLNVITQPSKLLIDSYLQEDITSCFDAPEGRIVIVGSGGFGSKNYSLDGGTASASGDFQNLLAGSHVVSIQDLNSCILDTTVEILAPPAIVVDLLTLTHISGCSGASNGEISISGSGGAGGFSYAIDGGSFQASGNFTNLLAGPHVLSLKDANDCVLDSSVTLTEPQAMVITAETITPITCAGSNDGGITISVSGGNLPLDYTLNPGAETNTTGIFGPLGPGTYTVSINDALGCGPVFSSALELVNPPELFLDSVVQQDISCFNVGNGSLTIYASGGSQPYEYSIDNGTNWQLESLFPALGPGNYNVQLRDASMCIIPGGNFQLSDPPELILLVTTTDIAGCAGDTTGIVSLNGSGGTGALEYSLNGTDYQHGGLFENLPARDYSAYLRDASGCDISEAAPIIEPDSVMALVNHTDAVFGNKGSISISDATGGIPPYEYSIVGVAGTFSDQSEYTDLEAGSYEIVVRDANGCTYEELVEVLDIVLLQMDLSLVDVSCFGADDGSISFSPLDAVGEVRYSIDSGKNFVTTALFENLPGNSTYYLVAIDEEGKVYMNTIIIEEPLPLSLSWSATPAECNAFSATGALAVSASGGTGTYNFSWSDGSTEEDRASMEAGTYYLSTTDQNDCQREDTLEVEALVVVEANAGKDTAICHGSSIQLHGEGGHTPSWSPVDFLDDPDNAEPWVLDMSESTTYVLTILEETSGYGCYNVDTVNISVHPLTGISAGTDTFVIRGGSVQLEALGGPFTDYRWDPETGLDNAFIPNPIATPAQSIYYYVYALNDYGCEESDSVLVEVINDIRAYNVFTPGGDGYNDFFEIENAERFPEIIIKVYSRWGDLLYSTTGYDEGALWDGHARGKRVPTGTYYYVIIPFSGAKPITGNVTVIWSDE